MIAPERFYRTYSPWSLDNQMNSLNDRWTNALLGHDPFNSISFILHWWKVIMEVSYKETLFMERR